MICITVVGHLHYIGGRLKYWTEQLSLNILLLKILQFPFFCVLVDQPLSCGPKEEAHFTHTDSKPKHQNSI